ncbi:MAG: 2-C-methyl-D-erythritol 4-phosphate cytidylyltransferase, partial [Eubacteriales bacterium]|nr:2-C-methyl-D-erythritol 4-phosphate cytidylyltransferase [Eubacteriales bacterium]
MQKNIVIIPCSGTGKRMGSNIPKQFLELEGKPIICHTIEKFEKCEKIDEIMIVISKEYEEYFKKEILEKNNFKKVFNIVLGGEERFNSVYNGLCSIKNKESIVLIHDGVRPFIKIEQIEKIIKETKLHKACVLGV